MLREPWFRPVDDVEQFRAPWFRILDVTEVKGRTLAEIVSEGAEKAGVTLTQLRRGFRLTDRMVAIRKRIIAQIHAERPDLSSATVGAFLHCDPSTVRRAWKDVA